MTNKERARSLIKAYLADYLDKEWDDWTILQNRIAAALDEAEKRGIERATETMTAEELENILDSTIRALHEKRPKKTYILVPKP